MVAADDTPPRRHVFFRHIDAMLAMSPKYTAFEPCLLFFIYSRVDMLHVN